MNLVPNGSFEDRLECIYNDSDVSDAHPWFNPQDAGNFLPGTPDLFHECANVNDNPCPYPEETALDPWLLGVPTNFVGCQTPRDGSGYAGGFFYYPNPDLEEGYREYLAVPLSQVLLNGTTYTLSFSVSLAERSRFAIWNVGAILTPDTLLQPEYGAYIDYPAHFQGTPGLYLDNKETWYDLEWTFEAEGGERFLYIGNFQPNSETDTISSLEGSPNGHYPGSCYYVDDVKLFQSVLVTDNVKPDWIHIYPNPVVDILNIDSDEGEYLSIFILDVAGRFLYSANRMENKSLKIDLSAFDSGLYLVQIVDEIGNFKYTEKIVKR